ncbi:MAG: phenylalanine--tRNA ligase subunit beta [Candidatus Korobacteraceae bacterium]
MKILPNWLREFVDIPADDRKLGDDLTNAGTAVEGIEEADGETVYEVEFTANRVDTMNHYGVARECAAIYGRELKPLKAELRSAAQLGAAGSAQFSIQIEAPELCARYTGRIVRNVSVAPSPEAVVRRLGLMQSRAINNVTDASNYTLLEMGHPTHCFDVDTLEGGKIIVRCARPGEKLRTLDGVERILHPEDLVIADALKPVALAGVMGGFDTMITEKTRNVLIEAAWFDPAAIRKTARRHGMHTDASHRFERGADVGATPLACALVEQRIAEWAGGVPEGGQIDAYPRKAERGSIQLRLGQVERVLGESIPEQEIQRILRQLGFVVTAPKSSSRASTDAQGPSASAGARAALAEQSGEIVVEVPSWRLDVEREIDLIEEVARIYGFDRFPATLPSFSGGVAQLPEAAKNARLRSSLLALGYNEAVSLAFLSREEGRIFSAASAVELANPVSDEAPTLRTSMLPGMLGMLAWNLNHGNSNVRLFESGHIFEKAGAAVGESRALAIGATGDALGGSVHEGARPYTFFDLKGVVETLLSAFEHHSLTFEPLAVEYLHAGRAARAVLDGAVVARFGQLHPGLAAERKLRQEVYLAEIDLERLYEFPLREPQYREISRYPAVERDFSFLLEDSVSWGRLSSVVAELAINELQSLRPLEIFRGGNVPAGQYSLLMRATFQSAERTLRDDDVAQWTARILQAVEALGGRLRA